MARLSWGDLEDRIYQTGVDRGTLYVPGEDGVPWNGLISVTNRSAGGDPTPYYLDGVKYANFSAAEEFEMSIEAFSSPREFGPCDGTKSLSTGLFVTQQPRVTFGFAYRSLIGDPEQGLEKGYKLHLIYNALASPSEEAYHTVSDVAAPTTRSWDITSTPEILPGAKPSAHLVVDTTVANKGLVGYLEGLLWGTDDGIIPQLPPASYLVSLFGVEAMPIEVGNVTLLGTKTGSTSTLTNLTKVSTATSGWAVANSGGGSLSAVSYLSDSGNPLSDTFARATVTAAGTGSGSVVLYTGTTQTAVSPNLTYSFHVSGRTSRATGVIGFGISIQWYDASSVIIGSTIDGDNNPFEGAGIWHDDRITGIQSPAGAAYVRVRAVFTFSSAVSVGQTFDATAAMAIRSAVEIVPFNGDSPPFIYDNQLVVPYWTGTADASTAAFVYQQGLPATATPGDAYTIGQALWVYDQDHWVKVATLPVLP